MRVVALCRDHGTPSIAGVGHDEVVLIDDLCVRPAGLAALPEATEQLVVGLHRSEAAMGAVQSSLRRLGFDPMGVGIVELEGVGGDPHRLTVLVAGAAARSGAYPGSTPEQLKLAAPRALSRRSLLTLAAPTYIGAPAIEPLVCTAMDGCRVCTRACPVSALTWNGGSISYDKAACVSCGICVTVCPVGAAVNPEATPAAIEAEVGAIVTAADAPAGIRYVCRDGTAPVDQPGWYSVRVPCTSMLTVGWLLAPLLMGAAGVDALACGDGGCRLALDEHLRQRTVGARAILAAFGLPDRIGHLHPDDAFPRSTIPGGVFGHDGESRVIQHLAPDLLDGAAVRVAGGQTGMVRIDPETCTACSMCAVSCPTGALGSTQLADAVEISFDPSACTACGQCLAVCPEIEAGAISLEAGFDLRDWEQGRQVVRRATSRRCERCGGPIAPDPMLDRIATLLGDEHAGALSVMSTICLKCRGR